MVYAALEWVKLGAGEYLILEGQEDVDRFVFDAQGRLKSVKEVQLKDLAAAINVRSEAAYESVFNFLVAFARHHQQGRPCEMLFATTAARDGQVVAGSTQVRMTAGGRSKTPRRNLDLATNVLLEWETLSTKAEAEQDVLAPKLAGDIRGLFDFHLAGQLPTAPPPGTAAEEFAERVKRALEYVDGSTLWKRFLLGVRWVFSAAGAADLITDLKAAITMHPDLQGVSSEGFAMQLIARAFQVAAMKDPSDRCLSRESLFDEANRTEKELTAWAQRVGLVHLGEWVTEFEARLDAAETKIANTDMKLAKHLAEHAAATPAAEKLALRLSRGTAVEDQAERAWNAYFRSRVAPAGLFVPPDTFRLHLDLFSLSEFRAVEPQLDALMSGMKGQRDDLEALYALLATRYGAGPHPALAPYPAYPRVPGGPVAHADTFTVLSALVDELERLQVELPAWQRESEKTLNADVKGRLAPDEEAQFYGIVYRTVARIGALRPLLETVRRLRSPVWMLTAPAGRGKSTLLWYAAESLRQAGGLVCVLSPQDFATGQDLLTLCAVGLSLQPPTRETFLSLAEHLWSVDRLPTVVAIDAINEAAGGVATTTALVASAISVAIERGYLRIILACRDYYWESTYSQGLKSSERAMVVDSGYEVQPRLDRSAVGAYLAHFGVTELTAAEVSSGELLDNPFLLRVFCETYMGRPYDGPRPVRVPGIELLEQYILSRSAELRIRGFSASLALDAELESLAQAMIRRVHVGREHGLVLSLGVLFAEARQLLSAPGAGQQTLLDAVLDMDLVLRRDLPVGGQEEVLFTFERMGSYFQGRALLAPLSSLGVPVGEEALSAIWKSENLSRDALGMLIGVALWCGLLTAYPESSLEALEAFPTVADVVGDRVLPMLSSGALERAARNYGVAALVHAAGRYRLEGTLFEPKGLALVISISGALAGRPVVQRHLELLAKRELIQEWAEYLEHDLLSIRIWVRRRFQGEAPRAFGRSASCVPICRVLLGAHCARIRDAAHEWLLWWGHYQHERCAQLAVELLDDRDLVVRERAIALLCAMLERFPHLATSERLHAVHSRFLVVPPEERQGEQDHYFITEFARRILLDHRSAAGGVVPAAAWSWIETPARARPPSEVPDGELPAASPLWKGSGPIGSDMAHYTFGYMFRCFAVKSLQPVIGEVTRVLNTLGYDPQVYDGVDGELGRLRDPRTGEGFRFERFGKLMAYQAAYIVLGDWAKSKPIHRSVSAPAEVFALDEPTFDYMFTIEGGKDDPVEAVIDFPTDMAWDAWVAHDERVYLRAFLDKFPDEVVLWGVARRTAGGRRLVMKVETAFVFTEAVAGLTWLERSRDPREEFYGTLPHEPAETSDFHTMGRVKPSTREVIGWDNPVLACASNLIRTLHHADKSVMSPAPSVVHALGLQPLPTAGEYADGDGNVVIRQVEWGDIREEHSSHLLLMKRVAFEQTAAALGVSWGRFEYMDAGAVDDSETGGIDREHFYRRWGATFSLSPAPEPEVVSFLDPSIQDFVARHGHLSMEMRLRAHHIASTEGETALRDFLEVESGEPWRRMGIMFDRTVIPHIDEIRSEEAEE